MVSSFGISNSTAFAGRLNAPGFVFLVLGMFAVLPSLSAADIEFVTQELPWAIADKPYSPPPLAIRASGRCPSGGIGFSVVGGEVPPVTLDFLVRKRPVPPLIRSIYRPVYVASLAGKPSAARGLDKNWKMRVKMERETGFEPATSTLARLHSTS